MTLVEEPRLPRNPRRNIMNVPHEGVVVKGVVGGRKSSCELRLCEQASVGGNEKRDDAPPLLLLGQ